MKKMIWLLVFWAANVFAQVAYVNSASNTGAGVSSVTISSYTVAAGDNRLLIVGISVTNDGSSGALAINSVTFNSVGLTQVCNANVADDSRSWIYRLIAPDVTTANIVVTFGAASAEWISVGAANFTGVDQTTPCGTCANDTDDNTTYSVAVTSAVNDLVVDVFTAENATSATVGANQTSNWNNAIGSSGGAGSSSREAGAASVTMSWTAGGSPSHSALTGVSLKAAAISATKRRILRPMAF